MQALNLTDEYINDLVFTPACYDNSVDQFIEMLQSYNLSLSAVTVIAEKIYEMVIQLLEYFS